MKRHLTIIALALTLAACGKEPEPAKEAAIRTEEIGRAHV